MAIVSGAVLGSGLATTNVDVGSASQTLGQGRQAELLTSDVHGKAYAATYAGNVFCAATAAAGTTIPVSTATAATFVFYNPIGSGVVMELIRYNAALVAATTVVGAVGLGIATGLTVAPTGLTVAPSLGNAKLGGGNANVCQVYTVATIVATTRFFWMSLGYGAVTNGSLGGLQYDFDGQIVLTPGSLAHVVGTAAQTSAAAQSITWAEWPQ